eukprot:11335418-Karenia_brevis.AAC.1
MVVAVGELAASHRWGATVALLEAFWGRRQGRRHDTKDSPRRLDSPAGVFGAVASAGVDLGAFLFDRLTWTRLWRGDYTGYRS